jgi:hypothetical protein
MKNRPFDFSDRIVMGASALAAIAFAFIAYFGG